MSENFTLLGDRLVVRQLEDDAAIFVPDKLKPVPVVAEVVKVGTGRIFKNGYHQPLSLNIGDKIVFSKLAAFELEVNQEKLLVLREKDVFGVIEN